ncbi:MAG: D-ribose pyranase [Calditrichae bacterium]|nr:D-ribose pyranase [Calditrichia bacterium]
MKKTPLLNAPLSQAIARMGHGDHLVLADSGLPVPYDKKLIDLAVTRQLPRLLDVFKIILTELEVEKIIITHEMEKRSPQFYQEALSEFQRVLPDIPIEKISHEAFKEKTTKIPNMIFVRSGEATPFANMILVAGVVF